MSRLRTSLCLLALLACASRCCSSSSSNATSYTLTMNSVEEDFCDSTKQLSGYFKISGSKSKNYFYWFFESRGSPSTDPVIIWLTGGPGCSSILALLQENGPCSVNKDLSLKRNPYSWTERANVLWIDQPVGVGFRDGRHVVAGVALSEDVEGLRLVLGFGLEELLQEVEHVVPHLLLSGDVLAHVTVAGPVHINLQGFGIGNGLTDPQVQYKYYPDMAYNNTYSVKAVAYPVYLAMKAAVSPCVAMIASCQTTKAACLAAQTFCNAALVAPYLASGLNVYDVRSKCEHPPMCYDFSYVEKFLRLESTLEKLHVSSKSAKWQSCNMEVHAGFSFDWMKNFHQLVPPMLEAGIRGLVYAGDADFIVNWMGCKAWTLDLPWSKHDEFLAAEDKEWTVDGKKAGRIRQVGPFAFQQVYEAGHMVPLDQPKNALALLKAFTLPDEHQLEIADEAEQQWLDKEALIKDESIMSVM